MVNKPVIVFVSSVYPSQYSPLCEELNRSGLAEAWFMTHPAHAAKYGPVATNIIPYQPDGDINAEPPYFYLGKQDRAARISRGVLTALRAFEAEKNKKIDVVVCHYFWGSPQFLYDEIDAAIVSYVEYPSFRKHGWDPKYPPTEGQRLTDVQNEMLTFHQVLRSDLTITPTEYAKSLLPVELQPRVRAQFEAMEFGDLTPQPRTEKQFTLAFSARDLSSCKGLELYARVVDRLVKRRVKMRFLAIGEEKASTYSYEPQWLEATYGNKDISFLEHLMVHYPGAQAIEAPGRMPYAEFSKLLSQVDLFLYPLKNGVGNWGIVEIMARGGCVIATDTAFLPEIIQDGVNGVLVPDDADDLWVDKVMQLKKDAALRARLSAAARETGLSYRAELLAPKFMQLFYEAMAIRDKRLGRAQAVVPLRAAVS